MNWSDERYVKLYTRDTLTWLSLGFEARATLTLMLRKVNGAGVIETGTMEAARAVAIQIVAPVDAVRTGLAELLAHEVVEMVPNGVALTNFIEAQEATKTESRKKRDHRQRDLDQRRQAQLVETLGASVPARPGLSPLVPLQPSSAQPSSPPAQLSPAQPSEQRRSKKAKTQGELPHLPPKPSRSASRQEELYQSLFVIGRKVAAGVDVAPDEAYSPAFINRAIGTWLALWPNDALPETTITAMVEAGGDLRTVAELRLEELFNAYFELTWPADCKRREGKVDTTDPQPYPFRVLASDKVWKPLVEKLFPDTERGAA